MGAPPGISYLLRKVPPLLFPGLLAYATTHYVKRFTGISLPGWAVFLCVVLAKPLQFLVSTRYRRYLNEKEAQKLGAKMAPHVQESGLAIVSKLLEMFDRGYPGDTLQEWASKHGNIYETRLPTEGFIWTTEPEHVKAILATEFENFPKESLFIEQMVSLLGDGIFSVNGEFH
ncbi:cytochrome P450 monooxygenase pc-3 [Coprinopsis cinerea AmutBmut pab1-1]|nr:cytochrome P450 monooxygenase pc-3 [Coprinopsis cinerea AmutBmut pab1-1]